ncbi:MAG TPA: hypothetical protein VFH13_01260, partial [Gemmatimonadaceae bacterium]|nr:hypothetical protein [Gemmatimonadaceae bacterium]
DPVTLGLSLDTRGDPPHVPPMTGRPGRKSAGQAGAKRSEERVARNARSKAYINLAMALAAVFEAGVYIKEDLQGAVCTYVAEMKDGGETGEGVVRAAQGLVHEVGARYPSSQRTQIVLADMVTWCLAEYYRESA